MQLFKFLNISFVSMCYMKEGGNEENQIEKEKKRRKLV